MFAKADSLYREALLNTDSIPAIRGLFYYQRAFDELPGNDSASLGRKVRLLTEMGDLLATQLLYHEAIVRYQSAYNYAAILQDTTNMIKSYQVIGDMYNKLQDLGEAVHYYDLAEQLTIQSKQEKPRISIALRLARAFMESGRLNLVAELLPPSPYEVDADDEDLFNYVMWHIYSFTNHENKDSANYFMQKMLESPEIYYRNYAVDQQLVSAIMNGDSKNAYGLLKQKAGLSDEISGKSHKEAIESVNSMYQALNLEHQNADLQFKNQQIKLYIALFVMVLVVVLAISSILIYRFRSERLRLEIAIRESSIYQHLLTTEKAMNTDEQAEVVALLNQIYPDFIPRLMKFGVFKEQDMKVCLLLKMGFKPSRIASLVSRSDSAIANTRARLYKKVLGKEGKAEDWDKIIHDI